MPLSIVWLIAVIVFVLVEASTMGLTSVWFACGALIAMIAALLGANLWWQLSLFVAGSALLLASTRKWTGSLRLGTVKTNADRIVGQQGVVILEIDNQAAQGQVRINGQVWTARSQDPAPIPAGAQVEVVQISGVKAIVKPLEQ